MEVAKRMMSLSMQVLLTEPSPSTSADLQAQASSSSRGPSGDLAQSSCSSGSHLWPVQCKASDDTARGHLSRQPSEESTNEQHAHPPGPLLLHDGHPRQDAAMIASCQL